MSNVASCPRCGRPVSLPDQREESARVQCPWCANAYALGEALAFVPPTLMMVDSQAAVESGMVAASPPESGVAADAVPGAAPLFDDVPFASPGTMPADGLVQLDSADPLPMVEFDDDLTATMPFEVLDGPAGDEPLRDESAARAHAGDSAPELDELSFSEPMPPADDRAEQSGAIDFGAGDAGAESAGFELPGATPVVVQGRAAKRRREPSALGTLLSVVLAAPIGLGLGYYILLWIGGPAKDFLEIGPSLPSWSLPAAFSKQAPPPLAARTPASTEKTTAAGQDASNDAPPEPDAAGDASAKPADSQPAGAATDQTKSDDTAVTAQKPVAPKTPPDTAAANAPPTDDDPFAPPADDLTKIANPDLAMPKEKEAGDAKEPAKPDSEPATAPAPPPTADAKDEDPFSDAAPTKPADESAPAPAKTDGPAKSDEPAKTDEPANTAKPAKADESAAATEPAPADQSKSQPASPDPPPAATTADDVPPPPEKLGPRATVSYELAEVDRAMEWFETTRGELAEGKDLPSADLKKLRAKFYRDLYHVAEVATFADAAEKPAEREKRRTAVRELALRQAADPRRLREMGLAAKQWLANPRQRGSEQGVLLAGTVKAVGKEGKLHATRLQLVGTEQIVLVVSDQPSALKQGDEALLVGSLVEQPAEHLVGYQGDEAIAVWSGMEIKLPGKSG